MIAARIPTSLICEKPLQERALDDDIQLISDGDGLAVLGNAKDVEHFLASEGLSSKDLGLQRLKSVATTGAAVAQTGSDIAANSGRWVKLTPKSARLVHKYGLRQSSKSGLSTGVVRGPKGQIRGFVEFAKMGPRSLLTNPALLSGAAGIMSQFAIQQAMDEITDYLVTIDAKVDDVLRAQKDAVLADMIGVDLVIEEAMTVRAEVGRVSEITWGKAQNTSMTIARTQAYALRQLDALAEKMEGETNIGDLAATAKEAESTVRDWLAVLARCFQLQDALAVLELDRVLDASPEELDGHRLGLKAARQDRLERISRSTECLVARMNASAAKANANVLLHPAKSPAVVQPRNQVASGVHDFQERLGIEPSREPSEARRWVDAATEVRDKALETGAKGVDAALSRGNETLDLAGSIADKLTTGIAGRARRLRGNEKEGDKKG